MAKRRANGEGSIYRDSNGLWRWRKTIGVKANGLPNVKTLSSRSQATLITKIKEFNMISSQGTTSLDDVALEDYIKMWLFNVKKNSLKDTSFDRAECTVRKHIIPKIGFYRLKKSLNAEIIQIELINKMVDEGLSFSSIKKAYVYLNSCLKYAVANRKLLFNYCDTVMLPSKNKFTEKEIVFLTDEEIDKFIKTATSTFKTGKNKFPYGPLYVFILYTGLRIGEMMALKWSDVDFDKKVVNINKSVVTAYDRKQNKKSEKPLKKSIITKQY